MSRFLPTMTDAIVLRLLKQALRVLSDRLLTLLVFAAACCAGAWALYSPNYHRDAIAFFFGILFLSTLKRERFPRYEEAQGTQSEIEAD